MKYIATFYSHFGAIRFKKLCDSRRIKARIMPVPRDLSSSCGTCVQCEGELVSTDEIQKDEVEQIAEITPSGYRQLYQADDN
jgi:hypothetical protein